MNRLRYKPFVLPTFWILQTLQVIKYTTFFELQFRGPFWILNFSPVWVDVNSFVLMRFWQTSHFGLPHLTQPFSFSDGSSLGSNALTRIFFRLSPSISRYIGIFLYQDIPISRYFFFQGIPISRYSYMKIFIYQEIHISRHSF